MGDISFSVDQSSIWPLGDNPGSFPGKKEGRERGREWSWVRKGGRVEISRSICVAALKTIIALFFVFGHFSDELLLLEVIASPVSRSEVIFPRSLGVQSFLAMLINI